MTARVQLDAAQVMDLLALARADVGVLGTAARVDAILAALAGLVPGSRIEVLILGGREPRGFGPKVVDPAFHNAILLPDRRTLALRLALDRPPTPQERFTIELAGRILASVLELEDPFAAHGLTPREREVAALAARGLIDRDIARELGIGFATVRTYLARAFARLGIARRTELAAIAARTSFTVERAAARGRSAPTT